MYLVDKLVIVEIQEVHLQEEQMAEYKVVYCWG